MPGSCNNGLRSAPSSAGIGSRRSERIAGEQQQASETMRARRARAPPRPAAAGARNARPPPSTPRAPAATAAANPRARPPRCSGTASAATDCCSARRIRTSGPGRRRPRSGSRTPAPTSAPCVRRRPRHRHPGADAALRADQRQHGRLQQHPPAAPAPGRSAGLAQHRVVLRSWSAPFVGGLASAYVCMLLVGQTHLVRLPSACKSRRARPLPRPRTRRRALRPVATTWFSRNGSGGCRWPTSGNFASPSSTIPIVAPAGTLRGHHPAGRNGARPQPPAAGLAVQHFARGVRVATLR